MFGRRNRKKRASRSIGSHPKRLRVEGLEPRLVLTPIVDVSDVGGVLALTGNNEPCEVEVRTAVNNNNSFTIAGLNGTLLTLNGSASTMLETTVHNITGNIEVNLGEFSGNTFHFVERDNGQASRTPADLVIDNDAGNINNLGDVTDLEDDTIDLIITGDLLVTETSGEYFNTLNIYRTAVYGDTIVDNGAGGGSKTTIDSSELDGGGATPVALWMINEDGNDILQVQGASRFGMGNFPPDFLAVDIDNGDGGSRTTFTGASQVYGSVEIDNGDTVPLAMDISTFNNAEVLGSVTISNGDGDTQTSVQNSRLGTHSTEGGPLEIYNDEGRDIFSMSDSEILWGLLIQNDAAAGGTSTSGSETHILAGSFIGELSDIALSIPPAVLGDAMYIEGDDGDDLVNISGNPGTRNEIFGELRMVLYDARNEVNITHARMDSLHYDPGDVGGAHQDIMLISATAIANEIDVRLGGLNDTFRVINGSTLPMLSAINVDGGDGWDRFHRDTDVTPSSLGEDNFEELI